MEYPKHLFKSPGPYGSGDQTYNVAGAEDEEQELGLLDRGWHETKEAAFEAAPAPVAKPKNLNQLRVEYQDLTGKKPFQGWKEAELRKRIGELKAEK